MDLDTAKENIQPLACGRNARYLEAALNTKYQQEILEERQKFEDAINNYEGNDPFEPWFQYISWIEQIYPTGGKESGLEEVLLKCIETFESDHRYYQDRRMIKVYIKYIDSQQNPQEYYQELYNQGIGTMVADLYICWAYYYDLCGNFQKADAIFRKGIAARAQPFDELDQAHKHFGFTMSQRILYQDESSQQEFIATLQERRHALTSLRHHKKKVGSIRSGPAIRSYNPGKIQTNSSKPGPSNIKVQVFEDQNRDPNAVPESYPNESTDETPRSHSIIRSIIDSARKQENMREPGPWSKAKIHDHKKSSLVSTSSRSLAFEILEDDSEEVKCPLPAHPNNYIKGIQLGEDHVSQNLPQKEWKVPICLENEILTNVYPMYNKTLAYPKPGHVYSPEEYWAYKWCKKRKIENETTKLLDAVWADDFSVGIRLYPTFADKNKPQLEEDKIERFIPDENISDKIRFAINMKEIYPENSNEEFQFEEILCRKVKSGERRLKFGLNSTILMLEEMDETKIVTDIYGRKSIFPSRKSMAARKSVYTPSIAETVEGSEYPNTSDVQIAAKDDKSKLVDSSITPNSCKETQLQPHEGPKSAEAILMTPNPVNTNENKTETAQNIDNDFVFKAPAPAVKPRPFEIYEEVEESPRNTNSIFEVNESCSTQTFNFFIKAQSVSTPKNVRKTQTHFTTELVQTVQPAPVLAPPTPKIAAREPASVYSPEFENPHATTFAKQLSTIMETTETNTVSSGTTVSTKSSVDTQMSSPEFDTECSKNYLAPKNIRTTPETIPEVSTENAQDSIIRSKLKDISHLEQKEDTVSMMMMSVKPFEEKTETVPKVMLAPKPSEDNHLYSFFTKTPDKKGPPIRSKPGSFEIDDSFVAFKKDLTLPKICDIERQQKLKSDSFNADYSMFSKIKEITLPKLDETNILKIGEKPTSTVVSPFLRRQRLNDSPPVPGFEDFDIKSKIRMIGFDSPSSQCIQINKNDSKISVQIPKISESQNDSKIFGSFPKVTEVQNDSKIFLNLSRDINSKTDSKIFKGLQNSNATSFDSNKSGTVPKSNPKIFGVHQMATNRENETNLCEGLSKASESENCQENINLSDNQQIKSSPTSNQNVVLSTSIKDKPSILEQSQRMEKSRSSIRPSMGTLRKRSEYFEENVRTEAFAPNTAGIKNSTWLPNHNQDVSQIQEKSLHIEEFVEKTPRSIPEQSQKASIPKMVISSVANKSINKTIKMDESNESIQNHSKFTLPAPETEIHSMRSTETFSNSHFNANAITNQAKDNSSIFEQSQKMENLSVVNKPQVSTNTCLQISKKRSDYFGDNTKTEAFTPNTDGIKNSTWLPNYIPDVSQIQEKSIHIKEEVEENSVSNPIPIRKKSILNRFSEISRRPSMLPKPGQTKPENQKQVHHKNIYIHSSTESVEIISPPKVMPKPKEDVVIKQEASSQCETEENDLGRSIYFTKTPKTPMVGRHYWSDDDDGNESFVQSHLPPREVDLDYTRQIIGEYLVDDKVNPFESELIGAFLDQIDFYGHLEQLPTCSIVNKIPALKKNDVVKVSGHTFEVLKIVGEGGYGTIFCAKEKNTEKLYALKQEKPPNLWEYYICLELKSRLNNVNIYPCFMDVEYAMIGQNSSLLISSYSKYGSLIAVCNKVKRVTSKNMDEYIVMILTSQILTIMDHLHASNIIHADIKPDNFLLISKLTYDNSAPVLQLIDFGISIDLALFPPGQKFTFSQKADDFKCVEMRENRPWTFQTDLFGLAGTIHVMLFGKYMNVEKKVTGWTHKSGIPRYFNKAIWDTIFNTLLNIRDCNAMPNLQYLRTLLKEEIAGKEKYLRDKIKEFNFAIDNK